MYPAGSPSLSLSLSVLLVCIQQLLPSLLVIVAVFLLLM
jgi:hypothetical protein